MPLTIRPVQMMLIGISIILLPVSCQNRNNKTDNRTHQVTVPFNLDHNRMLVNAEIRRKDGTWRKVRLWVDSGNPTFTISEPLALDLGMDLSAAEDPTFKGSGLNVDAPAGIRIGGMDLNTDSLPSRVVFQPFWLFSTMHNDANLPSTLLKNYQVVFDYPKKKLTLALPGSLKPAGNPSLASIQPETGIVQIDGVIDGDSLSFALDNGASYSFISIGLLMKYFARNPDWPVMKGTAGYANMWGWFPSGEESFPVVRIPEFRWGYATLKGTGMVGVTKFSPDGPTLGEWYSRKTARPVAGFLGANVLKNYRVEIDYANSMVYLDEADRNIKNDMDLAGISVRPLPDSTYQVVGVVQVNGKSAVDGVEPGDILTGIGDLKTHGETMGTVVDALRGKPGEKRILELERNGQTIKIEAKVDRLLKSNTPKFQLQSNTRQL